MRAHHGVTAVDTRTHRKPLSCETGAIAELLFDSLLLRKLRRQSFFALNKN